MLQPDNTITTNELLAYGFSSQRTFNPITPSLNATMTALLSDLPFVPPNSARWINALFFVSLILSLAAALLGIMAKQWLREYMNWNSPLAAPRENVLVRQIRTEEWDTSYVSYCISAIPVLLELAMILFLIGIVDLLWTMDDVVAIAVTTFVAIFILAFSALTILPVFRPRSPYKSPTAWACIATWHTLAEYVPPLLHYCFLFPLVYAGQVVSHLYHRLQDTSESIWRRLALLPKAVIVAMVYSLDKTHALQVSSLPKQSKRSRTWRDRDIESCRIDTLPTGRWWKPSLDAHIPALYELSREQCHLTREGETIENPGSTSIDLEAADALLVDLSETPLLLRALSWVQRASQDSGVSANIDLCMESIHSTIGEGSRTVDVNGVRMVTDLCILASVQKRGWERDHPELRLTVKYVDMDSGDILSFRREAGCRIQPLNGQYHRTDRKFVWEALARMGRRSPSNSWRYPGCSWRT